MSNQGPCPPAGPSKAVKWIVSILILWQFSAILTTVVAGGNVRFPSPPPSKWLYYTVYGRYLQGIFLTNPYRFYAPDPGPTDVTWFRVEYENGGARWYDAADRESFFNRMPYQRHMSLNMMLSNTLADDPDNPGGQIMAPQGLFFVQSYARHVAATREAVTTDGKPNPVKEVEVYHLKHFIAEPDQVRLGWDGWDLRLFRPVYLGSYDAAGNRTDVGKRLELQAVSKPMSKLAADVLADCVVSVSMYPKEERPAAAERLRQGLPKPFRDLLAWHPELLDPDRAPDDPEWARYVRAAVESRDDPSFRLTDIQRELIRNW